MGKLYLIYDKNFLNEDTYNMHIYLSNLILMNDEYGLLDIKIHQQKYKINKMEDKMRRRFYLQIVK